MHILTKIDKFGSKQSIIRFQDKLSAVKKLASRYGHSDWQITLKLLMNGAVLSDGAMNYYYKEIVSDVETSVRSRTI